MKLKTKLIMPLLAIVPTVATITTVATSCGNSEKKDKVAGKIVIEKICPDEDKDLIIMTASKESFTNKEATEGFEVEFKVNIKVETYTYPLFLLEKISQTGKELGKDQYEIQYDKEKGMYGNTFKVKFNPGVKPGDLKFTIRLLESAA
ncbi:MAG: hypothetical protein KBS35_02215, partial [Mycoplasma sp.]|nr:hypothetical protein [Candidatus Hennigella equi]